jgi:hypothetical protein
MAAAIDDAEECHRVIVEVLTLGPQPVVLSSVAQALLDHFRLGDAPQRWVWAAAGHLAALERRGEAIREPQNGLPAWRWRT